MKKFVQVKDAEYVKYLESKGFTKINVNGNITTMSVSESFRFEEIDKSKVSFTNRLTF